MDKFEQMVETIEEAEDMVECKECFDLFPKAECTKLDHGYVCPTCGRDQPRDFQDVSFTDITTDLYGQEFPDVMEYDSDFRTQIDERRPDYDIDTMVDVLVKDEFDAIDSYEMADEVIQQAPGDEEIKDDLLDAIEHIKEEEEEHIDELNKAAGRVEEDPEDEDKKDDDFEEDSDSEDKDDNKDEDDRDSDKEDDDKDEDEDEDDKEKNEDLTENVPAPEMVEGEEILDEKKESVFDKIWKPVNESLWVCKFKDQEIGTVEADTEEEAIEKMQAEYPEYNYGEYDGCFEVYQEEEATDSEAEILTEAGFLTNLFTKENQNLDTFFAKGYTVKVGNSTTQAFNKWADTEKFAAAKSKANPKEQVTVSSVAIPAKELQDAGWSTQLVNEFGGKDFVIATYRGGKVTLVDKAADLAKRLKAEVKSNKIMNKSGASSTNYEDQYGRNSITDGFKDSQVKPTATTVTKLANILFAKYTAYQGMAHPMSDDAKSSGSDIQIAEVKALGEFEDLATVLQTAAGKSSRTPVEGSGDAPVVEVYGYFKDFEADTLGYLEKYVTRSEIGALEEAKTEGGPVHLFTYSMGKAIADNGCASMEKFIKYENNIIEDLAEAGYDTSGKPGAEVPKKEDAEDDDLDLEDEVEDAEEPTDPKARLKAILGEKKDASGYTADSYAKYEALYNKIIAWIDGLKKPEAVADEKIEGYKTTAESKLVEDPDAGDADLNLEGESEETTSEEDAEVDKSEERGSAEFNKKYHGVSASNASIQAFRKLMMLTGMKVYDAMGNEVTADISGAKKITAEALNDFEVEVKGERQPLAAWITKMVKVGALHEDFNGIFESTLTEAEKTQKTSEKDYLKDQGISDNALSSFKKLFALTDLKVYDAFDKPVSADKDGMTKISSLTLVDFTVEYKGEKVPLIKFVAKLAKEKVLKESLYEELCDSCEETKVECAWCNNMIPQSECHREVEMGWLCDRCERAINSRGETLTFEQ